MTADHDARVYDLFVAADGLPPAERDALLARACPDDPAVRGEVARLLGHGDAATAAAFLATPLVRPAEPDDPAALVGARVGPYVLREHLGTGGMGRVYRAARADDFAREVAVKLLRPGVAAAGAGWRFARERDLLAALDHPHIARLLDAGTAGGQPYLAVEFVAGVPIDRHCVDAGLSTRQRLALFRLVCLAVHHAHQRLVLHRDLKPANVLVTADGRPKVLDFGIARPLDADERDGPGTHTGQVVGTPAYMSPEQAAGGPAARDVRTDVYALAVVGYELLAGRPPYDLAGKGLLEQLRVVAERDPVPLGRVDRAFRGDLETVFAKGLEKDPGRRYPSALDLAEDIERVLADRPVRARPPRAWYVAGKFARRNRAAVAGVAVTAAAVVVAAVAWDQSRAAREATARFEGEAQRREVESRIGQARALARRGEWAAALAGFDRVLAADPPDAAGIRLERAEVLDALSRVDEAERELTGLAGPDPPPAVRAAALLGLAGRRADGWRDQVQQAQGLGLVGPADRAFAAALLARTSDQSLDHLRAAVGADPSHRRAQELLFVTLVTLGRRPEAAARLDALRAADPGGRAGPVGAAVLAAYDPDPAALPAALAACGPHLPPADLDALTRLLTDLRGFDRADDWADNPVVAFKASRTAIRLMAEAGRLVGGRPGGPDPPPALGLAAPDLPVTAFPDRAKRIAVLEQATAAHPEGTLFYLLGRMLYDRRDYPAARAALARAVEAPAVLPVRRTARYWLLEAEVQLAGGPDSVPPGRRPAVLGHLRLFVAEGGIRPSNGGNLTLLARALGDRELALTIAVQKARLAPRDPIAHAAVGSVELQGGNYGAAVERFERALAANPDPGLRAEIQGALDIAREKLREQARRLAP